MGKMYCLFLEKCTAGDLDAVKQEITSNVNIEGYLEDGWAITSAAGKGHLDVVQYLFEKYGEYACGDNGFALNSAAKGGHKDVVKYLIEACKQDADFDNGDPLRSAASQGCLDVVKYLIKECDVKISNEALFQSAIENHVSTVKYLIENGADYTNFEKDVIFQSAEKYAQARDFCEKVVQGIILEPAEHLFQRNLEMLKNTSKKPSVRRRPSGVPKGGLAR